MTRIVIFTPGDRFQYPEMEYRRPGSQPEGNVEVIDRQVIRYRSKKYFRSYLYKGLAEAFVAEMHKNIEDNFDNLVVIYGGEGTGKSHLAYYIAKLFNPDFDMEKNYIYEYNDFLNRITEDLNNPPGTVYWLDEGSNIASNRDWMQTDNKEFIKVLEMFRSRGWTLIICIPKLDRLDLYIRETRARFIVRASIMSWDLVFKRKSRGYAHLTRIVEENDYRIEKKIGYFKYPMIPEPDASIYEKLKLQSQTKKVQELNEMKEAKQSGGRRLADAGRKQRALMLKLSEDGYSNEAIAGIVDMTVESVAVTLSKARKEAGIR